VLLDAKVTTMLLDAVARHNLGKDRVDKEVVEKVS